MDDYAVCGWHVRSAIPLPEAASWTGQGDADIEIRLGDAAGGLREPVRWNEDGAVDADGSVLFIAGDVARYRVRHGREVIVEPAPGAADTALRTYIYGTVLGLLCHQRGLLPLHAGAVAVGDRAILVAGNSGAGKSSVTAALVRQGASLLAEDLCPLSLSDEMRVLPSVPRFRLNRDVAEHLRMVPVTASEDRGKLAIPWPPALLAPQTRPMAIYGIARERVDRPRIERVTGIAALEMLRGAVFRWEMAHAMGLSGAALKAAAALAARVPCFQLWRTDTLSGLEETAALLLKPDIAS